MFEYFSIEDFDSALLILCDFETVSYVNKILGLSFLHIIVSKIDTEDKLTDLDMLL